MGQPLRLLEGIGLELELMLVDRTSLDVRPVADELLLEAPEKEVAAVRNLVREEMTGAYALDPPLVVDVGAGEDWNAAKD